MSAKGKLANKNNIDAEIAFQVPPDTSKILCFAEHPVKPWIGSF